MLVPMRKTIGLHAYPRHTGWDTGDCEIPL